MPLANSDVPGPECSTAIGIPNSLRQRPRNPSPSSARLGASRTIMLAKSLQLGLSQRADHANVAESPRGR
eukprot:15474743-Alexandrium_andersonii.AAC.1